jgi:molecular chaperone DnaK
MPSVVGLQKSGKIAIGKTAKRNQAKDPNNTIVEIKRKMGENVTVPLGQSRYAPQEISAMLLQKIKELAESELGEEVTGVVITCPAYFQDPQRAATKEAGQIAGFECFEGDQRADGGRLRLRRHTRYIDGRKAVYRLRPWRRYV